MLFLLVNFFEFICGVGFTANLFLPHFVFVEKVCGYGSDQDAYHEGHGSGYKNFDQLLKGAFNIDNHFRNTSFEKNISALMGLIGLWYSNFFGSQSQAILPYDQYLHRFAA